jgi:hypothetical protein
MKIRTGFISNSSASSFMIFGTAIDKDKLSSFPAYMEAIKKLSEEIKEDTTGLSKKELIEAVEEHHGSEEAVWALVRDSFLTCVAPCESDEVLYVGLSWNKVADNETGLQFKQRIQNEINRLLGQDLTCGSYSGAYTN